MSKAARNLLLSAKTAELAGDFDRGEELYTRAYEVVENTETIAALANFIENSW